MTNLGSDTTPVKGSDFSLPAGAQLDEDNGDLVIRDSGGTIVMRRDEAAGEWTTDTLDATAVHTDAISDIQVAERNGSLDINQAITDSSLPYGGVLIPPGTHSTNQNVTIQGSDLGIIGWGHGGSDIQWSGQELFTLGDASNEARDILFQNLRLEGTDSAGEVGFHLRNSYDTHIRNVYLRDFDTGFQADNAVGTRTIDIELNHFVSESNIGDGIVIDSSQSANDLERIQVTNGYTFGNGGNGVVLKDGSLGVTRWINHEISSNALNGLQILGASNNHFTQCKINNNNTDAAGNFDVDLQQDGGGASANNNRFVNCRLGDVRVGSGCDRNVFIGGQASSFQFGDAGGDNFVRRNTFIFGVDGWQNVDSGTVTDAEDGDVINYSLDDNANHVSFTVINNSLDQGVIATGSTGIGGGAVALDLRKDDGTAVTASDGVDVIWRAVGDTYPDMAASA